MLRNAVGCGRVPDFPEKSITEMYGSTLLALRGGGWVSNLQKNRYVTLELSISQNERCAFTVLLSTEFYRELSERLENEARMKEKQVLLLDEQIARKDTELSALERRLVTQEQGHLAQLKAKSQQVASLQAELDAKAGHTAQVMTQLLAYKRSAKEPLLPQPPPEPSSHALTHSFSPSPPKGVVPKLHRRHLSSNADRFPSTTNALQQCGTTTPMPDPSPFLMHRRKVGTTAEVPPVEAYHEKTVLPPITRSWESDENHTSRKSPTNAYSKVLPSSHRADPSNSTSPEVQLETLAIGQTRRDRDIRHAQKYNGTG